MYLFIFLQSKLPGNTSTSGAPPRVEDIPVVDKAVDTCAGPSTSSMAFNSGLYMTPSYLYLLLRSCLLADFKHSYPHMQLGKCEILGILLAVWFEESNYLEWVIHHGTISQI